jgi:hypothetical protein
MGDAYRVMREDTTTVRYAVRIPLYLHGLMWLVVRTRSMVGDAPRISSKGAEPVTTQTENRGQNLRETARETKDEMARGAKESASRLTDQTRESWDMMRDDPTPQGLMGAIEQLPATVYLYGTLGSMGASLLLRLLGRKDFANFVGLWPPTILSLAMLNKMLRPSKEM